MTIQVDWDTPCIHCKRTITYHAIIDQWNDAYASEGDDFSVYCPWRDTCGKEIVMRCTYAPTFEIPMPQPPQTEDEIV